MSEFKPYRRKQIAELRPYVPGETLENVGIAAVDQAAGSPKVGDMIARNPKNHADQWLVAAAYFADNFETMEGQASEVAVIAHVSLLPIGFPGLQTSDYPHGAFTVKWRERGQDYARLFPAAAPDPNGVICADQGR